MRTYKSVRVPRPFTFLTARAPICPGYARAPICPGFARHHVIWMAASDWTMWLSFSKHQLFLRVLSMGIFTIYGSCYWELVNWLHLIRDALKEYDSPMRVPSGRHKGALLGIRGVLEEHRSSFVRPKIKLALTSRFKFKNWTTKAK